MHLTRGGWRSQRVGREPERDVYFWIQFAEMWKSLADLAGNSRREECLKRAVVCLRRARAIRQKTEKAAQGRRKAERAPET